MLKDGCTKNVFFVPWSTERGEDLSIAVGCCSQWGSFQENCRGSHVLLSLRRLFAVTVLWKGTVWKSFSAGVGSHQCLANCEVQKANRERAELNILNLVHPLSSNPHSRNHGQAGRLYTQSTVIDRMPLSTLLETLSGFKTPSLTSICVCVPHPIFQMFIRMPFLITLFAEWQGFQITDYKFNWVNVQYFRSLQTAN